MKRLIGLAGFALVAFGSGAFVMSAGSPAEALRGKTPQGIWKYLSCDVLNQGSVPCQGEDDECYTCSGPSFMGADSPGGGQAGFTFGTGTQSCGQWIEGVCLGEQCEYRVPTGDLCDQPAEVTPQAGNPGNP